MSTQTADKKITKKAKYSCPKQPGSAIRLYARGVFVGYRRSGTKQHPNHAILRIEGLKSRPETKFYYGKRVAYITKATRAINGSTTRVQWGKILKAHGNTGAVRASFRTNLPPSAMGSRVRVMLYPSNI